MLGFVERRVHGTAWPLGWSGLIRRDRGASMPILIAAELQTYIDAAFAEAE